MAAMMKLACLAASLAISVAPARAQVVMTRSGPVAGVTADGVSAFKGSPFAAPPVGALRWQSPKPVKPWTPVRQALANAPACVQDMRMLMSMGEAPLPRSEDCLYLNVWKPAAVDRGAPVMVWIHGGAFTTGGTGAKLFDGAALVWRGVVVVTVAYRLGALGFLAAPGLTSDIGQPGNYGIEDQLAALRWVQANIARFGGDPKNVTLFGESAGAMSVSVLAGSPVAKGLFHKVIARSGASFAPARTGDESGLPLHSPTASAKNGAAFLAALKLSSVAEARQLPAEAILAASSGQFATWAPTRDGRLISSDQYGDYAAGKFNAMPALIGYNNDEGSLFVQQMTVARFDDMVRAGYGSSADVVLAAYPHATDAEALASARQLMGDAIFGWPATTWAKLQAAKSDAPVYAYYNEHVPPLPPVPMFNGVRAFHGSELAFVFGNAGRPPWRPQDRAFSDQMMGYWVNFARTGNPNGSGLAVWPRYDAANPQVMRLDEQSGAIAPPGGARFAALDRYFAMRRSEAGQRKPQK